MAVDEMDIPGLLSLSGPERIFRCNPDEDNQSRKESQEIQRPLVMLTMCGDLPHNGHVLLINRAAEYGNVCIGLLVDEAVQNYKRVPIMKWEERAFIMRNLKNVRYVIPQSSLNDEALMKSLKPEFTVHGDDWKYGSAAIRAFRQRTIDMCQTWGGQVVEPPSTPAVCTTELITKIAALHDSINDIEINAKTNYLNQDALEMNKTNEKLVTTSQTAELERNIKRRKAIGQRVLSEANDLKRTIPALAKDIGWSAQSIQAVVAGETPCRVGESVLSIMTKRYPLQTREVCVDHDDTSEGALILTSKSSSDSERVFQRYDPECEKSDYYAYRDTAFSRFSPFRPEWIRVLRVIKNNDPHNPSVVYNNGHLLLQTTLFVGKVNFYYEVRGEKHVAIMNTGDSNFITPFCPHTFTSRDENENGLILAITFGAALCSAVKEHWMVSASDISDMAGDLRAQPSLVFAQRLKRHLEAECMVKEMLSQSIIAADSTIDTQRASELSEGCATPTLHELEIMADCLNVKPSDLLTVNLKTEEEVVVAYAKNIEWRSFPFETSPSYLIKPLARTRHQPLLKPFLFRVQDPVGPVLHVALHTYVYNYGELPVNLVWGSPDNEKTESIEVDGSAYILPLVPHHFDMLIEGTANLYLVRIPGALSDSTLDEFASIAINGRSRAGAESKQWY